MIDYHGTTPHNDGIVVANHTSIIDVMLLIAHSPYSIIGQRHAGFLGFLQKVMSKGKGHVWFERSEMKDRKMVANRLKSHTENRDTNPVLVFPEGTCVNNNYCCLFRKGVFELDIPIYPVAIKYNKYFADCFWDSRRDSFPTYLFNLMTSWAVVADVWFLPRQEIGEGESPEQFADRVQTMIAETAGLIKVNWSGYLKRERVNPKFLQDRQKYFADRLMQRLERDATGKDV